MARPTFKLVEFYHHTGDEDGPFGVDANAAVDTEPSEDDPVAETNDPEAERIDELASGGSWLRRAGALAVLAGLGVGVALARRRGTDASGVDPIGAADEQAPLTGQDPAERLRESDTETGIDSPTEPETTDEIDEIDEIDAVSTGVDIDSDALEADDPNGEDAETVDPDSTVGGVDLDSVDTGTDTGIDESETEADADGTDASGDGDGDEANDTETADETATENETEGSDDPDNGTGSEN